MNGLWLRLKLWHYILIVLGVPLGLLLLVGMPTYYFLGAKSPIWDFVSTISPTVSALTVVSLVILNFLTMLVMRAQLKAQATPSIVAYFDNSTSILIDLVVKNTGYGAAKEVSLKISPPLLDHNSRDINELSLFKKGVKFFPPNREFRQIVGTTLQFFKEGAQRPLGYELTISCRDAEGNPVPDQIIYLDLSVYRDLPIHRKSDVAEEVAELRKALERKQKGNY